MGVVAVCATVCAIVVVGCVCGGRRCKRRKGKHPGASKADQENQNNNLGKFTIQGTITHCHHRCRKQGGGTGPPPHLKLTDCHCLN